MFWGLRVEMKEQSSHNQDYYSLVDEYSNLALFGGPKFEVRSRDRRKVVIKGFIGMKTVTASACFYKRNPKWLFFIYTPVNMAF